MFQIEALKAAGVTEVVLAINYQPEVRRIMADTSSRNFVLVNASRVFYGSCFFILTLVILPTSGYVEFLEGF
jgi:hypothetical protein